jgi:hypothetical protein
MPRVREVPTGVMAQKIRDGEAEAEVNCATASNLAKRRLLIAVVGGTTGH